MFLGFTGTPNKNNWGPKSENRGPVPGPVGRDLGSPELAETASQVALASDRAASALGSEVGQLEQGGGVVVQWAGQADSGTFGLGVSDVIALIQALKHVDVNQPWSPHGF